MNAIHRRTETILASTMTMMMIIMKILPISMTMIWNDDDIGYLYHFDAIEFSAFAFFSFSFKSSSIKLFAYFPFPD